METILAFAGLLFFIWILSKVRKTPSSSSSPKAHSASPKPNISQTSARAVRHAWSRLPAVATEPFSRESATTAEECWISAGREVKVAGHTISGGMLYVGKGLKSISGVRIEPALIDPSLAVSRSNRDRAGATMTYWPSYGSMSSEARAAYLEWLANGRQDPTAYIGYVFLYFYGLERRALAEAPRSAKAKEDVAAIAREVERLLQVYGGNRSFNGYATRFLDVLTTLQAGNDILNPVYDRAGNDLPLSVRVGLGRIVTAGRPISGDWALSWFLTHPETSLRTPMQRCAGEFADLFRLRYAREHGDGFVLQPNRTKLKMTLTPASASFGGQVELAMDLPDVTAMTSPFAKIRQIADQCAADLDAFSRWVGRNANSPKTIAAVALLPPELATTHESAEARGLWSWLKEVIGTSDLAVCKTDDLLRNCPSFGDGKLAKSEAVLLAQFLEKGGFGIEPDVRFGGAPLTPGGTAVVFRLTTGATAIASPQYAAATVLLHLAVAVSAADGTISPSEEQHLQEHLQRALALGDAERLRLSAHLAWLMQSPPSLTGLKKRLEPLEQSQRSAIADFIISVAGADGQISPDEIRTLGKVYPMLGLASDEVYSHVHAMASGATARVTGDEPATVIPGRASVGYAIPSAPGPAGTVQLDMAAVKAKLAQSAQVSALLDDIFTDDEVVAVQPPPVAITSGKLTAVYASLLSRLAERSQWSRTEFEALATEHKLLPDGAVDTLNEAAFEHAGAPVLEGDDPIEVDNATAKELL